jgi:tetratricopeptide (TPR) repeat protein
VQSLQTIGAPALEDLQPSTSGPDGVATERQTPLKVLGSLSYVHATAWIVGRLAEGLQHAHQRGVLHRDIKPSNILLGADGQPMLLDFNLAQNLQKQDRAEATLGGTVAYMSPEHLRALANPNPDTTRRVDHRSDLYSLGMVLFEMLTGHSPFDQSASYSVLPVMIEAMAVERSQAAPSVRQQQPGVPWSLESILRKCLAPEPTQRYQQAEDLAEDLRRFLDDRPLKHAPELSQVERVRKWVRRHPRLASSGMVVTAASLVLLTAGAALVGVHQHLTAAEQRLEEKDARERLQAYEAGTLQTLCLINTVTPMEDHLPLGLRECEKTLGLYGILERDDWQTQPAWQHLSAEDRQRLAEHTQELLMLLAWARVRSADKDVTVLRQALDLLDCAERIEGLKSSKALWMDRAAYLQQLGDTAAAKDAQRKAEQIEPSSTRDHYLLATTYSRQRDLERALIELTSALQLNPKHYWSWNQRGICHQEQGDYFLAVSAFSICIGLQPELPWGHFNQGYALHQSGKKAEAINAYTRALQRDPQYLPASFNRGLAHLELKHHAEALADFDQARRLGRQDAPLHAGRGMALEGLGHHPEADAAFDLAFTAAPDGKPAPLPMRLGYAFTVSSRLPARAREVFQEVLSQQPRCLEALYGLAMLEANQDHLDKAIQYFDQAIEVNYLCLDARRYRAVLLARRGHFDPAKVDITLCLKQDPQGGSTLYAAACVLAHIARHYRDHQAANQALDLLEQAFHHGYGRDLFAKDPDLAGLRNHPDFQELLTKGSRTALPASR